MGIQVIKDASASISIALNAVNSTTRGLGSMATIFEVSMAEAEHETIVEAVANQKKSLAEHSVTTEELAEYKQALLNR